MEGRSWFRITRGSVAICVAAFLLLGDALAGPARFYFERVGLEPLIYVPKGAALLFVLSAVKFRVRACSLGILTIFTWFSVIAWGNGAGFASIAFSWFLLLPFLFGVLASDCLREDLRRFAALGLSLFVVTALGVYLDAWIDFPWKGFSYSLNGAEIEASREWTTMGLERVSGFSRMSAAAAFYLVCSSLFLVAYLPSRWQKWTIAAAALPAVVLTTNKAGIGAFVVGIAAFACAGTKWMIRLLVYGVAVAGMAIPLSASWGTWRLNLADPESLLLLASFDERLTVTWPDFFNGVATSGNAVTGVGFGGVGSAVKFFGGASRSPLMVADNFFLYLYGCFGIVMAVFVMLWIARCALKLLVSNDLFARSVASPVVALLAAGVTTDVIEAQIFALFLGIALPLSLNWDRPTDPEKR